MATNFLRPVVIGGVAGGLGIVLIGAATSLPAAWANDEPVRTMLSTQKQLFPAPFDASALVRFSDEEYLVNAVGASLEPESSVFVRKIGYGNSAWVTISTTPSGVYSSDAIASRNVRYPGIEVERLGTSVGVSPAHLAQWTERYGWTPRPLVDAGSFVTVAPYDGGRMLIDGNSVCVLTRIIASC